MRQVCNMHTLLLLSMGERRFWFGLVWLFRVLRRLRMVKVLLVEIEE